MSIVFNVLSYCGGRGGEGPEVDNFSNTADAMQCILAHAATKTSSLGFTVTNTATKSSSLVFIIANTAQRLAH